MVLGLRSDQTVSAAIDTLHSVSAYATIRPTAETGDPATSQFNLLQQAYFWLYALIIRVSLFK